MEWNEYIRWDVLALVLWTLLIIICTSTVWVYVCMQWQKRCNGLEAMYATRLGQPARYIDVFGNVTDNG